VPDPEIHWNPVICRALQRSDDTFTDLCHILSPWITQWKALRKFCLRSVGRGAPTAKKRAVRLRRRKLHHQSRPILSSHQVMVSH
jgi:hypothetical protein